MKTRSEQYSNTGVLNKIMYIPAGDLTDFPMPLLHIFMGNKRTVEIFMCIFLTRYGF